MEKKLLKLISKNWILLLILIVGLYLRVYQLKEYFAYSHDQDLLGWFYLDVVKNHHLRLIGQETSTQGIFIGPLFYYLAIPFYILAAGSPLGPLALVTILGLFTIYSFYFVFKNIFSEKVGLISSLIYSISFYTVMTDRELVPTEPLILWSVWFLWSLYLYKKGKIKESLMLVGFLISLIWYINFALLPLFAVYLINIILVKRKLRYEKIKYLIYSAIPFSLPLIIFELRHGFSQTKAFVNALTTSQDDIFTGYEKFRRVEYLISKNISSLYWNSLSNFATNYLSITLILILLILLVFKIYNKWHFSIFIFWYAIIFLFFATYSKPVSEYYLNSLAVLYIGVGAVLVNIFYKKSKILFLLFLIAFSWHNIKRLTGLNPNKSGYIYRSEAINEVKKDSLKRGFPCVSISYITKPGYDLGWRYLIYDQKLKLKKVSEDIPVYTIVFPLNDKLFPADTTFGAVGLIYPDYPRYNLEKTLKSCEGEDYNMAEPMFGFTN